MKKYTIQADGFCGTLYPASGDKKKVLITLSGSEGGIGHAQKLAAWYAENGVAALAVGYFKVPGAGKSLSRVPLEYIEAAVAALKDAGYEKIGIDGVSKGAELAAVAASRLHGLSCVILHAPTWYVGEGLSAGAPSGQSCWMYQGKELPFTPYKIRTFHVVREYLKNKEFNILPYNMDRDVTPETEIPVENMKAPVLIVSTKADTVWPSWIAGAKLEERLRQHAYPYPVKHICLDYACHILLVNANSGTKLVAKSERQHPQECVAERKRMGEEMLEWVRTVW